MSATIIESHDFQRQTRTDHLVRFMMAVSGLCVAAAGIASTIVSWRRCNSRAARRSIGSNGPPALEAVSPGWILKRSIQAGTINLAGPSPPLSSDGGSHIPKFVIEREMPGVGKLTDTDFKGAAQKSCDVLRLQGPEIQWIESYVTGDKIYCVYHAPDERDRVTRRAASLRTPSARSSGSSVRRQP